MGRVLTFRNRKRDQVPGRDRADRRSKWWTSPRFDHARRGPVGLGSLALGWLRRDGALSFNRNRASVTLLFRNRNRHFQYAIMELRLSLVHLGSFRQRNASIKEPILALCPLHSSLLLFLFEPAL